MTVTWEGKLDKSIGPMLKRMLQPIMDQQCRLPEKPYQTHVRIPNDLGQTILLPDVPWPTPLVQWPFPGMVLDTSTGQLRWEAPGDRLRYNPVGQWGVGERLTTAMLLSLKHLPLETQQQLAELFAPQNLKYMVGTMALWAGSHFFGGGQVFDVGLLILGAALGGFQLGVVAGDLWEFVEIGSSAQSMGELEAAGQRMARVISTVGVDVILGIFLKKARIPDRISDLGKRIEDAGIPGMNRMLGEIEIPPITVDDLHFDMYQRPGRLRHDVPIVPANRAGSANALRRASQCSGMTCGAVVQGRIAAMATGVSIEFRHPKLARLLRLMGHPPKREWMKMKTIDPDDVLLGAPDGPPNRVGYFDPKPVDPGLKARDPALYERLQKRYQERKAEFRDPGLKRELESRISAGQVRLDNGVVVDAGTGKSFVGDYDLYAIRYPHTRRIVPTSDPLYAKVMELLGQPHVDLQHPGHVYWAPGTDKGWALRQRIIENHIADVPLTEFRPDGSVWRTWVDPAAPQAPDGALP